MPTDGQNVLSQALQRLTLADVWDLAPVPSAPPTRDGLVCSPFREERTPSYSISRGLTRGKDFGSGEDAHGVWTFVKLCRPDWSKKEIANLLVERAGLQWPERSGGRPDLAKLKDERKERERRAAERMRRERERLLSVEPLTHFRPWSDAVRAAFNDRRPDPAQIERLAERRGWPVEWPEALASFGMLAFPELPWKAARYSALVVAAPGGVEVGYKQRVWGGADGPDWIYVPHVPREPRTPLQLAMADEALRLGIEHGQPMVPPLPFVLGAPDDARVWALCEGEWDAISLYGALGGFEDSPGFPPVAVFGIRGAASGQDAFLRAWVTLLRQVRPHVWLIADNDRAGASWGGTVAAPAEPSGVPAPPTFAERIRHLLGAGPGVKISRVTTPGCKDFNDVWKAVRPTQAQLVQSIQKLFTL